MLMRTISKVDSGPGVDDVLFLLPLSEVGQFWAPHVGGGPVDEELLPDDCCRTVDEIKLPHTFVTGE